MVIWLCLANAWRLPHADEVIIDNNVDNDDDNINIMAILLIVTKI